MLETRISPSLSPPRTPNRGTATGAAKMRLLERLMKTLKQRLIGALLLERHEKWQLETPPSLSKPKVSSFNAFSHYQDW